MGDAGDSPGGFNLAADPGGLTAAQVGRMVGFSDEMIRRWAVEEGLPHTTVDGQRRFRLDEVRAWIAANNKGQSSVGGKKPGAGRKPKGAEPVKGQQELEPQRLDLSEFLDTPEKLVRLLGDARLDRATAAKAVEAIKAGQALLKYREQAGQLISVSDVERTWSEALQVWSMRLDDAARRMSESALGACGLSPQQHETLSAVLARAMDELKRDLAADPLGSKRAEAA